MLQRIAEREVVVETLDRFADYTLFPAEIECLGKVTDRRRIEFATGRECVKRALRALGLPPTAILIGAGREPVWPSGLTGSITHCSGYCAAVVTKSPDILSIGVDAEENLPIPDGVLELVANDQERAIISNLDDLPIHWDRLLFSAKEAVYKAWYSITMQWLEFSDCHIAWDPCQVPKLLSEGLICGAFVAQLKRTCWVDDREFHEFQGRYIASPTHLATLIQVR
jgi:4'-phosphopantetheinyl transferase EntD